MRVLVTGGSGYLGAAIVRALHARGHQPVVYARRASSAALPGVRVDGDVRDSNALRRAATAADAIVHCAALVSIWRPSPREFDEVNVGGLHNVLDVARAAGTARVVYTSSFLALPPAGHERPLEANDYQRTKVRALEVARAAAGGGAPLITLFPGVVYGPGAETEGNLVGRLITDHLRKRLPGLIGAERQWSYAYVDDVAEAHVTAVELKGARGEYVVGGVNAPQMRVFEIVRELTGRRLPRRLPFAAAEAIGLVEDARARWLHRLPLVTSGAVKIFRHDWPLDSARSIAELNYRITPLETGVSRML
jgi:NAD+-dependent farnesol dehydrogenase